VRRPAALLLPLALLAIAGACHGGGSSAALPTRSCALTLWYRPAGTQDAVQVVGSWDGWTRPGRLLDDAQDGWRATRFDDLAPGSYEYTIVDDGQELADPTVPTTAFHEGREVTWIQVPDCDRPALRVDAVSATSDGVAGIDATLVSARSGVPIDASSVTTAPVHGAAPPSAIAQADPATGKVHVDLSGLPPGKSVVALHARDARGLDAEPALATVWTEPRPWDWRDAVVYEVMVDRYRARDGSALAQPDPPSGWAGGHVGGVQRAVESGELQALGVNTIWLTPLYANPSGTFPGGDARPYSAYHGYWPTESRALDPALAGEADVDALVAAAHARGMRVLFDVVPHHVHQEHPYFALHKSDGWFQHVDGSCVCGTGACDWSTHLTDCWFTPYLPSLDWTNDDVASTVTGDVLWWLERFDGDGVRIDAVPMMPRAAMRRIAAATRAEFDDPSNRTYLLGENFVGADGYDLLRYQLGPAGLDGEFDFPLMWTLRGVVGQGAGTMADVDAAARAGEDSWAGSGAVMGLIVDNHDTSRFVTAAAGQDSGDSWTAAPQPADPLAYAKQQLALGAIFTLPGAPVLYYGDEVALAGKGDPDSRRVMPAESALTALQKGTRDTVRALGAARACSAALRRGTYRALDVGAEHLAFARENQGEGDAVVVVLQRATTGDLTVPLPGISAGTWVDVVSGVSQSLRPELTTLPAAPFSVALYVPASSPCAPGAH
jgi:glycosidase